MRRRHFLDRTVRVAAGIAASGPFLFLLFIAVVLLINAYPSILFNGTHFLTGISWNLGNLYGSQVEKHNGAIAPAGASYGALALIVGTLASSILALLIAVPISLGAAVFLAQRSGTRLAAVLGFILEMLAGIPSVVYGLWGLMVLGPLLSTYVSPLVAQLGGWIPFLAGPVGEGLGLFTAGVVLAVMILPIIAATSRDLLQQVPDLSVEGGLAVGMTRWETVRLISFPLVRSGVIGAVILGWARAMGETMAILMVSGNATNYLPPNLYSPISTMASNLVAQLDGAMTDPTGMAVHALAESALLLLGITLVTNLMARLLVSRTRMGSSTVGRGN